MANDRSGYVYQNKKGAWYARTTITDANGKRRYIKRRAEDKQEAKRLLKTILSDLEAEGSKALDLAKLTFNDLADFYTAHYCKPATFVDGKRRGDQIGLILRQPVGAVERVSGLFPAGEGHLDAALGVIAAAFEAHHRIDPDGKVTRIMGRELDRPNGVLVSADDRHLFVADNNNNAKDGGRKLWRFELRADGTVDVDGRRLLYDWGTGRGPDPFQLRKGGSSMSVFPRIDRAQNGRPGVSERYGQLDAQGALARPIGGLIYLIEEEDLETLWNASRHSPRSGLVSRH